MSVSPSHPLVTDGVRLCALQSLQTTEVGKAPQDGPPVNVWEKRQKERSADHPEIQTTTSKDGGSMLLYPCVFFHLVYTQFVHAHSIKLGNRPGATVLGAL